MYLAGWIRGFIYLLLFFFFILFLGALCFCLFVFLRGAVLATHQHGSPIASARKRSKVQRTRRHRRRPSSRAPL